MKLAGKRVLVTGGGRRFGAMLAARMRERGAEVVIHCRTAAAPGAIELDFMTGTPAGLLDSAGPLDALVNNASVFLHASPPELRRINFEFPAELNHEFFRRHHAGAIVNILDAAAFRPSSDAYLNSKYMLWRATALQAAAFAPQVRVNAVAPGPMIPPPEFAEGGMKKTAAAIPLHRAVDPEDAVAAVVFLLENESITGAVLPVDCGLGMTL